jgi:hypothetical protein
MPRPIPSLPAPLALALLVALVSLGPGAASASLIGQTVGVSLTDGGALSFADNVVVAEPGPELTPGDGSSIGGVLLPTESVDVRSDRIVLSIEEGAPGGGTGYPAGTHYTFSNLVFFDGPTQIVGIHVTTVNLTNLGSVTFTGSSVTVPLSELVVGEIPGVNVGSLTVVLDTVAIPEPATATLVAAGLAWAALAARRSAAQGMR